METLAGVGVMLVKGGGLAAVVYALGHTLVMLYAMRQGREITPTGKLGRYKFGKPTR